MKKKTKIKERINEMDKIYNNLSIENLTKTDWFNQLNYRQKEEIRLGLESNLDVSIFANPEYNGGQMREIRLGLKANIDVYQYANLKFKED